VGKNPGKTSSNIRKNTQSDTRRKYTEKEAKSI